MRVGFRARQTAQPFTWSSGPVAFQQGLCPLRAEDLAPGRYAVTSVPREPSGLSRDRGGDGRGPGPSRKSLGGPQGEQAFPESGNKAESQAGSLGSLCSLLPVVSLPWR